jgi:hypothetical protein
MARTMQEGIHYAEQSGTLPLGVKIKNVRLEGNELLMDVQLPQGIPFVKMDLKLTDEEVQEIKVSQVGNLVRVKAPWRF